MSSSCTQKASLYYLYPFCCQGHVGLFLRDFKKDFILDLFRLRALWRQKCFDNIMNPEFEKWYINQKIRQIIEILAMEAAAVESYLHNNYQLLPGTETFKDI